VTLNDPLHERCILCDEYRPELERQHIHRMLYTTEATSDTLVRGLEDREPNTGSVNNYRARARVNGANTQLNSPSLT
jgi:hypothetical protein